MDGFAETYQDARRAFREAAAAAGGRLKSAAVPGLGAEGEDLTIDWTVIGRPDSPKTLLTVSGVHGAEGQAGSAAQRAFLAALAPETLGADCNVVVVHALNPWGVSHGFRVDADNIDLSRNFGDFDGPSRPNPDYARIHEIVCPDAWDDGLLDRTKALYRALTDELGAAAALTAFTGGQHSHPDGIGFGGLGPSSSRWVFERIVEEELTACRRMGYLEWHTGFGTYGQALAVSLDPPGSPARRRLAGWWADQDLQGEDEAFESGETPDWSGLLLTGLRRLAPHVEIVGAPVEIGTVSNFEAFEAVMIDRWMRLGRAPGDLRTRSVLKDRLRHAYDPPDPAWRRLVVEAGRSLHAATLDGLRRW
ncbi:M14 family metallopeptidase [Caulobacter mirabilis]|nr:M14 family metallopeptidase [Caulobacter mirabilis]